MLFNKIIEIRRAPSVVRVVGIRQKENLKCEEFRRHIYISTLGFPKKETEMTVR